MGRKGAEKEAGRRGRIGSTVMRKKRAGRKGVRKLAGRKGRQEEWGVWRSMGEKWAHCNGNSVYIFLFWE